MDIVSITQYFEKASLEQLREWRRIVLKVIYKGGLVDESAPEILKIIDFYLSALESAPSPDFIIENEPASRPLVDIRIH